jgi:aldehyde:ferredoxin oxidoreductase
MLGGYMGEILNVDLSGGTVSEESPQEKLLRDFIGGAGLGARIIFSRQKAGVDPLGPDNIFAIATGPFVGAPIPGATRYQVMAKSPLTGTWGDANAGGDFAIHLKRAGCDAAFFAGISEKPVYLLIDRGKAELRDASHLWGKDTFETEDILKSELGQDIGVVCIGPAGEKLSLISSVMSNKGRAAARSGLGAVMGSKRLKAVAVRGNLKVPLVDEAKLKELRRKLIARTKDPRRARLFRLYRKFGNVGLMHSFIHFGASPYKNYRGTMDDFPDVDEKLGADKVIAYQVKREPCPGCPVGCGGRLKAGAGEYSWEAGALKPEFESMALGMKCLVGNVEAIIKACDIANRYGVDHCYLASMIAFAMECYENGLIDSHDTGGIELNWGNARAMVDMTEMIAKREGFGEILADGLEVAAKKIGKGAEQYAIHVHGQDINISDPRLSNGLALGYIIDATPARHTVGSTFYSEAFVPPDGLGVEQSLPYDYIGKGEGNRRLNAFHNVVNATGMCFFMWFTGPSGADAMIECFKFVCGWDFTLDDMLTIGDRIATIRTAFNLREGINPITDFKLPARVMPRVIKKEGRPEADLYTMRRDYLEVMDWDQATFMPSRSRLEQLGLEDVAEALGV